MSIHAVQYLRAGSLRTVLVASGVLFGSVVVAGGVGYWFGSWRSDVEQLPRTCHPGELQTAKNGRRYCATYRWLDAAPPGAAGQGR